LRQDNTFDRYYLRFHRSIFMGTGPLFWWNRDCEREPHTSDRFECSVCLWLAILNHSACTQIHQYAKSGSELSKLMLSESSGSLEDKVKFKKRVQQARRSVTRRNNYRRCLGKQSNDFPFGFLKIPFTDKVKTNFYFQRLFLTDSVWANSKVPISSSRIPYCFLRTFHSCHHPIISSFSISYGALLKISGDQSIQYTLTLQLHPYFDFS